MSTETKTYRWHFACPHCGHTVNYCGLLEGLNIVLCDTEDGGCGEAFVLDLQVHLKHQAFKMVREGDKTPNAETRAAMAEADAIVAARRSDTLGVVTAEVLAEVSRAVELLPTWPNDPLHALAVLGEEFGELTKATLQSVYEPHKAGTKDVRTEAIQTAAMALRFLLSLDTLQYRWVLRADQHVQGGGRA